MFSFFEFVIKCVLEAFSVYAGPYFPETLEDKAYLTYGQLGFFVFAIFCALYYYIEYKKSFAKKYLRINNAYLLSIPIACIGTLIYFVIAYIFFYK